MTGRGSPFKPYHPVWDCLPEQVRKIWLDAQAKEMERAWDFWQEYKDRVSLLDAKHPDLEKSDKKAYRALLQESLNEINLPSPGYYREKAVEQIRGLGFDV